MWMLITILLAPVLIWFYVQLTMGICRNRRLMKGKTVVITGGNDGIGLETSIDLAARGAHVIIGCRRTAGAKDKILQRCPKANVDVLKLDLSDTKTVKKFASEVKKMTEKIDVLINNAGIAGSKTVNAGKTKRTLSADGKHEVVMATNFYGHVVLNHLLMDLVKEAGRRSEDFARIILVSSILLFLGNLSEHNGDFDLDQKHTIDFEPSKQYRDSKLAQALYTIKLAKIFEEDGTNVAITVLHPGLVRTSIFDGASTLFSKLLVILSKVFGKSPLQGAQTTIYAATEDLLKDALNGKFFFDCRPNSFLMARKAPNDLVDRFWTHTMNRLSTNMH